VDNYLDSAVFDQPRLAALLRTATGIEDVKPETRPQTGASVSVMLTDAIGTKTTQRISLQTHARNLALYTWPAELKSQAKALYQTARTYRLLDFARHPGPWQATTNVHLAFRLAPPSQRLYMTCRLGLADYIRRWQGDDFTQIREHPYDHVREDLWPWLKERQYASPEDDHKLDGFLQHLGRRPAHLRPGIQLQRLWPQASAADLDQAGTLISEIRRAVAEVLTVLDEPLPPACSAA
jgi:hypothetical protein